MFNVFQIELTDAMVDEVNNAPNGWSDVVWGKTYCDMTFGSWGDGDNVSVMEMIVEAIEFGLVKHTMTVDCEELEQVFALGNGMGDQSRVTNHMRHKSVSVGDIVLRSDARGGAVCARNGWDLLSEDEVKEIETLVPQRMEMS